MIQLQWRRTHEQIATNGEAVFNVSTKKQGVWESFSRYLYEINRFIIINDVNIFYMLKQFILHTRKNYIFYFFLFLPT
jgi:hypothetical protein